VHFNASIGHDTCIGNFSSLLPGSRISGNATVGKRSMIGSNAFVASGVKVGDDCRVDVMTYVRHPLPDGFIASVRSPNAVKRVDLL
jgi:UDP-3-O-[3-hydroxymyristoyl] glucosamine N-acyltransferase